VWQHQTICHKRILLPLTTEASLIVWQEIKGYNETIVVIAATSVATKMLQEILGTLSSYLLLFFP